MLVNVALCLCLNIMSSDTFDEHIKTCTMIDSNFSEENWKRMENIPIISHRLALYENFKRCGKSCRDDTLLYHHKYFRK